MDNAKKSFPCESCEKSLSSQSSLNRHVRSVHSEKAQGRAVSVNCPLCRLPHEHYNSLLDHLSSVHCLSMKEEAHDFLCTENFLQWKQALETATSSRFVKLRGTAPVKSVRGKKDIYVCHRSGNARHKEGKRLRHCKKQGSKKINAFCPARMKVITTEGDRVFVNLLPTHVGHTFEGAHLTLSRSDKEMLLRKIAARTSFEDILNEMRQSDLPGRLKFLTKKDLLNIIRDVKLMSSIFHKNDLTEWVKNHEDSILFYKPRGTLIDGEDYILEEDFIICLVNAKYIDLLGSSKYSSLDSYESQSADEYNVFTVTSIVNQIAVCCACMITNRKDLSVMELFLDRVIMTQSVREPRIIFHDSGVLIDAWCSLYGRPDASLHGTWHMEREWRDLLTSWLKNKPVEKHEALKALKSSLNSKSEEELDNIMTQVRDDLKSHLGSVEVDEYFWQLSQRVKCWAPCYRSTEENEVNNSFDRIHRTVKCVHSYFKSEKTLEFMASSIVDIMVRSVASKSDKLSDVCQMHAAASKLSHNILLESENLWKTWENEAGADVHVVRKVMSLCSCTTICPRCQACQQCYICSCADYKRDQACVHIHLICMNLHKFNEVVEMAALEEANSDEVIVNEPMNDDGDFGDLLTMIALDDVQDGFETNERSEVVEVISEAVTSEELEDGKLEIQQQFGNILSLVTSLDGVNIVKNAFSLIIPALQTIATTRNVELSNGELSD